MCSIRPRRRCNHGFTLIELLLAVAILGVVASFIFVSISATMQAVETMRTSAHHEQMVRSALTLMAQDLTLSRNLSISPWLGKNQVLEGKPADVIAFVTTNQPGTVALGRHGDQTRVVYLRMGGRLIRYVRTNLLTLTEEGVERSELLDDILGFNVRYYDGQAKIWVDRWDGRTTKVLPQGFMIELSFNQGADQPPKVYTAWLTLPT